MQGLLGERLPGLPDVLGLTEPPGALFRTGELSFTVPWAMFADMPARYPESFLMTHTWQTTRKKIARSRKAWGKRGT